MYCADTTVGIFIALKALYHKFLIRQLFFITLSVFFHGQRRHRPTNLIICASSVLLEYQIAILRDKYDYLGENYCTDIEKKLAQLADFPPLNDTCYPAVPEKYLVPRVNGWRPTKAAIDVMIELAGEVNDRSMIRNLKLYRKCHGRWMTRKIAGMLCQTIHQQLIVLISEKIQEGTRHYSKRIFDEKIEDEFNRRLKKAVKRQQKLIASGIRALVYREEPFTTAKDSLEFHVYLMIDEKCRKNRKVRIEEVR